MLRQTPLQLREVFFPRISVQANVSATPEAAHRALTLADLDISFAFDLFDGDTASAVLRLATVASSVGQTDGVLPYAFDIEVVANFDVVSPAHQDEMALYLRRVAAAAALIGAAREQVAMTSARGPWGSVMLPLIGMDSVVGAPPAAKKAATKKST